MRTQWVNGDTSWNETTSFDGRHRRRSHRWKHFLTGCFTANGDRFLHRVPFIEEGEQHQRTFLLCAKQFKTPVGLVESGFQCLRVKKENKSNELALFGYQKGVVVPSDWFETDIHRFKDKVHQC